ncbi:MAG: hypothetical protein K6F50_06055 [Kiritimatiellae bacterium]|nr:hypothetical protein [Kiritimatiellia bacterium]
MTGSLIAAIAFQVGPFYQQRPAGDYWALRPLVSREEEVSDVLWPVFTAHRDWWRFCYLAYWQDHPEEDSWQFTLLPLWFNGRDGRGDGYWGLFPFYGRHPHVLMMDDFTFALWPVWHRYTKPRGRDRLVTNAVLFPFVSWRSDGAWSVWPLYGVNLQRESDHRYALWPLVTWASYREDRDTAGEGYSWMVWPLYGIVDRARESQHLILPPFFSYAETGQGAWRLRCPWPFVDIERTRTRNRTSIWPFYERSTDLDFLKGGESSSVTRFGWKLVEIYDDEVRVFPFWVSGDDHFRLWPLWESETEKDVTRGRFLDLFPIRWIPAVDRNWSKFWTFYENESCPLYTDHSLLWGIIRWRTCK